MSIPKLGNCPRCGRLYLRTLDICDHCRQKQEDDFMRVAEHLRQFPGCSIQELSEATEVTISQIRQFILSGRILAGNFPQLTYPCENCGDPINSGKICPKCMKSVEGLKSKIDQTEDSGANHHRKTEGYISKYL